MSFLDPVAPELPALDLEHLHRATFADRALEREVLTLFLERAPVLLDQLRRRTDAELRRYAAHTLLGSARGIGAPALVHQVELFALQRGGRDGGLNDLPAGLEAEFERLRAAVQARLAALSSPAD